MGDNRPVRRRIDSPSGMISCMVARTGVFCLEGDWDPRIGSRQSVEPMLQLLSDCGEITYIHRDVATRPELEYHLSRWFKRGMSSYRVGYLGFHASRRTLHLGRDDITLEDLAQVLAGTCSGKILYFGACSTLAIPDEELKDFCRVTGARGVVGYTKIVGYVESLAFDLILLSELVQSTNFKSVYTRLRKDHPELTKKLGLRMAHKSRASDRSIAV